MLTTLIREKIMPTPKSPLAIASQKTQLKLSELLDASEKEEKKSKKKSIKQSIEKPIENDAPVRNSEIYFKVNLTSYIKKKSPISPGIQKIIKKELQDMRIGCLTQGRLDTASWNRICQKIRDKNLEVKITPPTTDLNIR